MKNKVEKYVLYCNALASINKPSIIRSYEEFNEGYYKYAKIICSAYTDTDLFAEEEVVTTNYKTCDSTLVSLVKDLLNDIPSWRTAEGKYKKLKSLDDNHLDHLIDYLQPKALLQPRKKYRGVTYLDWFYYTQLEVFRRKLSFIKRQSTRATITRNMREIYSLYINSCC